MGGSPCKAWNWRNPIVQTLFTQGPARTASVPHKRGGRPLAPARGEAVVPPGVLRGRRDSRNVGAGRPKAVARVGASQPPEPGLFRLWDGDIPKAGFLFQGWGRRLAPALGEAATHRGGGGRAKPARPGPLAPAMFGPKGRTPPPPPKPAYRALSLAPSLESSTP